MDSAGDEKKGCRWKRTRHSQRNKQDLLKKDLKQADLELLQQAAQDQHIELKYLNESGFCLWSPVSYSYSRIGVQKCLEQTQQRYGGRITRISHKQSLRSYNSCPVKAKRSQGFNRVLFFPPRLD